MRPSPHHSSYDTVAAPDELRSQAGGSRSRRFAESSSSLSSSSSSTCCCRASSVPSGRWASSVRRAGRCSWSPSCSRPSRSIGYADLFRHILRVLDVRIPFRTAMNIVLAGLSFSHLFGAGGAAGMVVSYNALRKREAPHGLIFVAIAAQNFFTYIVLWAMFLLALISVVSSGRVNPWSYGLALILIGAPAVAHGLRALPLPPPRQDAPSRVAGSRPHQSRLPARAHQARRHRRVARQPVHRHAPHGHAPRRQAHGRGVLAHVLGLRPALPVPGVPVARLPHRRWRRSRSATRWPTRWAAWRRPRAAWAPSRASDHACW